MPDTMSLPYYYYKANIFPDIIVLVSSTLLQTYNITSYDYSYVLFHCLRKEKENQKKRNIKLRKIDKKKRKMLVFKYTITIDMWNNIIVLKLSTSFCGI